MNKTITRLDFDRAEDNMIKKGWMEIGGERMYGFHTENYFYYTVSNKYFKVER